MMRNREQPRGKLLLCSTESNREWHTTSTPLCTSEKSRFLWPHQKRTPKILLHASRHWWTTEKWSMMSTESTSCITILSVHTAMRENSLANLWQIHSAGPRTSLPTVPKPVDVICHDKHLAGNSSHNGHGHTPPATSKDCPNCTWQHPAGRTNCPTWDSHCCKCNKIWHWGWKCHSGKPPQPKNAPPPRNAPPTGSQHGKSRCLPRNHNHHPWQGW